MAVEAVGQASGGLLGLDGGGQPTGAGASHPVGQDLGQALHQAVDVVGVSPAATALHLAGHDVVAALHQAAQVGELGLHALALGAQRAKVGHGALRQPLEVLASEDLVQLVVHACLRWRRGRVIAGHSRPGA